MAGKTKVGQIYETNYGPCVVIAYENSSRVLVKFDNTGNDEWVAAGNLRSGLVKDNLAKSVHGVGIIGKGKFKCRNDTGSLTKEYSTWSGMIDRCYGTGKDEIRDRVYDGCSVTEDWHNFQNYAEWASSDPFMKNGYALDKDILVRGNRVYSPATCVFVPVHINSAVTLEKHTNTSGYPGVWVNSSGNFTAEITMNNTSQALGTFETAEGAYTVYKAVKEAYVKALADVYKGKISQITYDALKNWSIE